MKKHSLHIQLRSGEGAALRTIGLVERRGFRLESMTLSEASEDRRSLDIHVTSERPVELLKRQLERLHDVLCVELKPSATAQWAAPNPRN